MNKSTSEEDDGEDFGGFVNLDQPDLVAQEKI
jgi:hypothetical protein